jgi:hypothetical protein
MGFNVPTGVLEKWTYFPWDKTLCSPVESHPMFRIKISPTYSGSKDEISKKRTQNKELAFSGIHGFVQRKTGLLSTRVTWCSVHSLVIITSCFIAYVDFGPSCIKKNLHGLSPRANYTDRATAACPLSVCQLLRIEGATWSTWRIPTVVSRFSRQEPLLFYQVAPQLYSRGWVDPVPDPLLLRKSGSSGNRTQTSGSVGRNSDH